MFYKGFIISFNNFTLMMFILCLLKSQNEASQNNTVHKSLMQAPRDLWFIIQTMSNDEKLV